MSVTFDRIARAIGVLNSIRVAPLAFGHLHARFLHWGVTPPAYWRSGRYPNPCETHKHSFYEICHAFTGTGKFQLLDPDTAFNVRAGDTFFARPGVLHRYGSDAGNSLGICFWSVAIENRGAPRADRTADSLLDALNAGLVVVQGNTRATSVLSLIFDEALSTPTSARLAPLLSYLLLSLSGELTAPPGSNAEAKDDNSSAMNLWRVGQYVQDHCSRALKITDVATRCGYSSRHLARLFKAHFGESFSEYLQRVRIQTASHLLLSAEIPLKQVARKSGFNSLPAFVRSFRRVTGVTPGEYRKRSLGAAQ